MDIVITVVIVLTASVILVSTVFEMIIYKDITALILSGGFNVGKKYRLFLKSYNDDIMIILENKENDTQHLIERVLEKMCFIYFYSGDQIIVYNEITKRIKEKRTK